MAAILCLTAASTAHAQAIDPPRFDLRSFTPTAGPHGIYSTEKSDILEHLQFSVRAITDYMNEPLQTVDANGQDQPIVEGLATLNFTAAIGIYDYVELGLVLPFILLNEGSFNGEPLTDNSVGDILVRVKARALRGEDNGGFGLAFGAELGIPVGEEESFTGDGGVTGRLSVVPDFSVGPVVIAANLGVRFRGESVTRNITRTHDFDYRAGVEVEAVEDLLRIGGEIYGTVPLGDAASLDFQSPAQFLLGTRFFTPSDLHFTLAAGGGLNEGVGTPRFQIVAGAEYAPMSSDNDEDGIRNADDACPEVSEDFDGFDDDDGCPDDDNDRDGIPDDVDQCVLEAEDLDGVADEDGCPDPDLDGDLIDDAVDQCPESAEDFDQFEDEDGCPDPDNDGDAIPDEADRCPIEAEDPDGFQDEDGCPELDNDGDTVEDTVDACPMIPEDADGFEDGDGCPEIDNDRDGIYDSDDQCNGEKEVINGIDDDDGCPDEGGKRLVAIVDGKLVLAAPITYEKKSAALKPDAYNVLNQLALTLLANPEIKKVRIEAHTSGKGDAGEQLERSQKRAQAALDYMIALGVESKRMEAVGMGDTAPKAKGRSGRARKINERVEVTIAE